MTVSFGSFLSQLSDPALQCVVFLTLCVILVNGWTDAPNAIATAVGTGALRMGRAIALAAVCNLLGAVLSAALCPAVAATVLEIGSLFLIYKWSYGEPLIRLIIAGPILMGCMFLMRTHRLGLVFFAVAIVAIYGQTFPAMPEQEFPGFYRQRIHRPRLPEASHKFDDSRISQHISQTQARNSITLGHRFYNQQIRIFFQQ